MSALPPEMTIDALGDGDGHAIEVYDVTAAFGDKALPWVMRAEWWIQRDGSVEFRPPVYLPEEIAAMCSHSGHDVGAHWASNEACVQCSCEGFVP